MRYFLVVELSVYLNLCNTLFHIQRLITLSCSADVIVFLKGGKVLETGTHDELLKKNGQYADYVRRQMGEQADK